MPNLTGEQITQVSRVLASTLDFNALQEFTHASTGDRLFTEYVAPGKALRPTIVDLLNVLGDIGTEDVFLRYVINQRPDRDDVRNAILAFRPDVATPNREVGAALSAQRRGEEVPDPPPSAAAPGLQKNVRPHLKKVDVRIWLDRLTEIERRVCRVESAGNALGTGFLVGPDAVLTNWHVVESVKDRLSQSACRFDYVRLADGSRREGALTALADAALIDHGVYAPAEMTKTPDAPPPTPDELDYALLKLVAPTGHDAIDGRERGWIALPSAPPALEIGGPLLIVQHPDGAPMKLALDTEAILAIGERRLRYATNTDPGSSGSPCFTMDWDLVALHHYGDPAWGAPQFNQGVPIAAIRNRIVSRGFAAALGS